MSDDVAEALQRLRGDVSGARLAPAAVVRRKADRHRAVLAAVPVAGVLAAGAVLLPGLAPGPQDRSVDGTAASPTTSPPPPPPLLPGPWRLAAERDLTLSEAARDGDAFCGVAGDLSGTAAVRRDFTDGARSVRIYTVDDGDAANAFKRFYSRCNGLAPVASEAGPANYAQPPGEAPSAALWDDETIHFIAAPEPAGSPEQAQRDLRDVVAGLIETAPRRP